MSYDTRRFTFVGREDDHRKRVHIDKYIAVDSDGKGKPVAVERTVPFRKRKD